MKIFTNAGGSVCFHILKFKSSNGIFWARIECFGVSDNGVIGWFLASILLKLDNSKLGSTQQQKICSH